MISRPGIWPSGWGVLLKVPAPFRTSRANHSEIIHSFEECAGRSRVVRCRRCVARERHARVQARDPRPSQTSGSAPSHYHFLPPGGKPLWLLVRGKGIGVSTEVGPTNTTAVQASARVHVAWREVILFVVLAYGLAWAWAGFWLLPYLGDVLTQSTTPTDMVEWLGPAATLPTMLTPMIAALIMRIFVSKEGLKGALGLLRSPKYYLAALIVPAVFVTAVVLIVQVLELGEFRWSEATWFVYLR